MPEYLYKLPFDGKVMISQGWNGPFSHHRVGQIDMRYAIDFQLPFGTEVKCARRGKVATVFDFNKDFYTGYNPSLGLNVRTNFVMIDHEDGTAALYSHLKYRASSLQPKQIVNTGDIISLTGESGWIPVSHLHFQVFEFQKPFIIGDSIQVRFSNYSGPMEHNEIFGTRI